MWDVDYDTFFRDCDEVFKEFLAKYGFIDAGGDEEEYEKFYKSDYWLIEINMLCNFPHIGVCRIIKSINDEYLEVSILEKFLNIDQIEGNRIYKKFKTQDIFSTYKGKMLYVREDLETFYKPLLTGEFTYEDYKKFEASLDEEEANRSV
ncbi:hypothetical protein LVK03_14160 [Tenacibaculum maritimum]|uniref:hypothetical protein n=3 Tax=Tenacibaculum maritimum TaxID=107401 RepID=UPI001E3714A8|nr:hypothetical protein [Tenacibaculum maritimum]MCD9586213.1 hypothetical protein [Tenacibaculum maritimum]MCD9631555.1 hypothetical protein [Tenacibaculum maritimum]